MWGGRMNKKPFWNRMVDAYYKDEQSSARELNKVCGLLENLCLHADEDVPLEYRTRHFNDAMDDAVVYLKDKNKESKDDNT